MRLAISQLPREPTFRSLGYATLTRDYAILPMLGRSYWPMLAMLSLPYTAYAHAILCWCFILAYSDSNTSYTEGQYWTARRNRGGAPSEALHQRASQARGTELPLSLYVGRGPCCRAITARICICPEGHTRPLPHQA